MEGESRRTHGGVDDDSAAAGPACPREKRKSSSVTFAELPLPCCFHDTGSLLTGGREEDQLLQDSPASPETTSSSAPKLKKSSSLPLRRSSVETLRSMLLLTAGKASPSQHVHQHDKGTPQISRRPLTKSSTFSARSSPAPTPAAKDCNPQQELSSPFGAVSAGYLWEGRKHGHERWAHQPGEGIPLMERSRASSHGGGENPGILESHKMQARRTSHGGGLLRADTGKPLLPTRQSFSMLPRQASSPLVSTSRQGSCRTNGSALFEMPWDSTSSTPRCLSSSGSQAAYEEMSSQGYALPSSQGRSRRSWSNIKSDGSCAQSVADHVALYARRSSQSGCESNRSSTAFLGSRKGKQPHPSVDVGFKSPPKSGMAQVKDVFQSLLG
ncbi:hypothetical protein DUNSADRAFT_1156 [Dunaliella salina]|uniref:Uncharacterized protein n=1 Tax=Dunaliella salina TaxID=3046 RepID=A0ABQ7GXE7_DUNSA|nr:hypothetical protein DUNSADRAFT_1156 [Dunaliella salina]|eukprot:KAF5839283.1 hypothetical protein DUNSADRAFT_1156 [Dunaliella salina]